MAEINSAKGMATPSLCVGRAKPRARLAVLPQT
jgi:hypothetical protein